MKSFCATTVLILAALCSNASATAVFSFSTSGIVAPTDPTTCPNPFAGCSLTATGLATVVAANFAPLPGPWNFTAVFRLDVPPLSATEFHTTGTFMFDDTSAANDDLAGTLDGILDATTFSNAMTYSVTSGSGRFAGSGGAGASLIQITPQGQNEPFTFVERGQFTIPEPSPLLLLALALTLSAVRTHGARHSAD